MSNPVSCWRRCLPSCCFPTRIEPETPHNTPVNAQNTPTTVPRNYSGVPPKFTLDAKVTASIKSAKNANSSTPDLNAIDDKKKRRHQKLASTDVVSVLDMFKKPSTSDLNNQPDK